MGGRAQGREFGGGSGAGRPAGRRSVGSHGPDQGKRAAQCSPQQPAGRRLRAGPLPEALEETSLGTAVSPV